MASSMEKEMGVALTPGSISLTAHAYNTTRQTFLAQQLQTADTHWTRLKGLIGTPRSKFLPGSGLWIIPCQGVHTMWMRFPIDVIYLNHEMRVVHIENDLKPWRIAALRLDTESVLELPARTIWETGTQIGDIVEVVIQNEEVA